MLPAKSTGKFLRARHIFDEVAFFKLYCYPIKAEAIALLTVILTKRTRVGWVAKKHLKLKGTRNYYFKTICCYYRTTVKSPIIVGRFYAT